jgi:hypothetical protein
MQISQAAIRSQSVCQCTDAAVGNAAVVLQSTRHARLEKQRNTSNNEKYKTQTVTKIHRGERQTYKTQSQQAAIQFQSISQCGNAIIAPIITPTLQPMDVSAQTTTEKL